VSRVGARPKSPRDPLIEAEVALEHRLENAKDAPPILRMVLKVHAPVVGGLITIDVVDIGRCPCERCADRRRCLGSAGAREAISEGENADCATTSRMESVKTDPPLRCSPECSEQRGGADRHKPETNSRRLESSSVNQSSLTPC
jgi:hypothetical protein